MSTKPETTFTTSVHRAFKPGARPYFEKMYNPLRGGTPDVFYSGSVGDLWVEYKFIPRIPITAKILPDLSPLQARWLNNRYDEGRNVAVIVGSPDGGVIFRDKDWLVPIAPEVFKMALKDRATLANWIAIQVGVAVNAIR